ncbi:MAG TPA: alpha/beta hydrolase [Candidatus Binataceae bacterium]|nr:alpha/beta hydrolase [Candidatus Binataceae bacterium]
MSREDFSFASSSDGLRVAYYRWRSAAAPAAIVQIAHGLGEHALRYARLAAALNAAGFAVYANDHRGHGRTATGPDALGDFGEAGWDAVVQDALQLTHLAQAAEGGLPVVLLGHSMGSFVAQQYILDHSALIAGCALSGSAARDPAAPRADSGREGRLEDLNASFEPARTPFDWLSRDPAEVDAYIADPLCGFSMRKRSRLSARASWGRVSDPDALRGIRKDLPIYIFAGDEDPVNHHLEYLRPLAERYRSAGLRDVTEKYYAGGRHEMFNEINRDEVTADLLAWLRRVIQVR